MPRDYGANAIDNALSALDNMPEPDNEAAVTGRKVIEGIFDRVEELLSQGHSYGQICDVLKGANITLSPNTLQGYVRDIRKERAKEARRLAKLQKQAANQETSVHSGKGTTPVLATPAVDAITATLESDDYAEVQ